MTEEGSRAAPDPASDQLRREVRESWDANAAFWNERMGEEGNAAHREILLPALARLLELTPGTEVLEIACGTGVLARWMASQGARVLAVDLSERMIEHARSRPLPPTGSVSYRTLDAADPSALRALGQGRFSLAVCNMALMDMAAHEPLARALPELLVEGGRFVFTVTHPVFNSTGTRKSLEEEEEVRSQGADLERRAGVFVFRYATTTAARGLAMVGQPRAQLYFDRSITQLLRPFLTAGLVLDAFEELGCPPGMTSDRVFSWPHFPEIPPFLAVRLRKV
jgi:SAM-dependent methyltransferase